MRFSFAALSALLLGSTLATSAMASNYPPGYVVESRCLEEGPVRICALNQHYGTFPQLSVDYKGTLPTESLKVWIGMNGRDGVFSFAPGKNRLVLNNPNAYMCIPGGYPEGVEGPYPACVHTTAEGGVTWAISEIPDDVKGLFYYARDQFGKGNTWDVQLAFVSADGQWDSLEGANYQFRFKSYYDYSN